MGINFKKITDGKVGDIIYPAYNGTNGFWKQTRWEVVTRISPMGQILDVHYVYDYATIKAIELIREFPQIIKGFANLGNGVAE